MLDIDVDTRAAQDRFNDIGHRLDSARPLLDMLIDEVHEYEADLFATGGNGQWAPDSPATIDRKGHGRVLVDTGRLLDLMTSASDVSGEDAMIDAGDATYAKYLKRGARGAPPRDPAPEPPSSETGRWAEHLLDYVIDGRWL